MIPAALHSQAAHPAYGDIQPRTVAGPALRLTSRSVYNHGATARNLANAKLAARQRGFSPRINSLRMIDATTIDANTIDEKIIDANASAPNSVDDGNSPKAMLLVIQTETVDSDGQVWSVSIMRLTVFHAIDRQAHKEVIPKST